MKNDLRWIIAMWFIERALAIAPNDDAKRSLLSVIYPWAKKEKEAAALLLVNRKAGKQ